MYYTISMHALFLVTGADQFVAIGTPQGKPCVLYVSGSQVGKQFVQNLKDRDIL